MTNYFTAISGGNEIRLHFVCDAKGNPLKLGDGTFGCVFHTRDSANQNYALKIFYEPIDEFVCTSQIEEMGLGNDLRARFKDQPERAAEINKYLVVANARVENFKSSCAYKTHQEYFTNLAFQVSDKAIVMDIYPLSLKDLLERGWPMPQHPEKSAARKTDEQGLELGGGFAGKPGYSILRSLPQREREKCILPLVRQLAEALSILQVAKCNHQDIKPANVLLRKVGPGIEVALADLGFVNTGQFQVAGSLFQMQPLGTRHYRSPEQTDFFDICEVDIHPLPDGDYELITHDPKFRDTFSERGDLVVFSKLPEKIQWEIKSIEFEPEEKGAGVTRIRIEGLPCYKLQEDVRTQITVNKRQTDRTDIFGFGAIIFDALTCGRSPERFYDLLRIHDRPGEIDKGLAQRYVHFRNGGGTIPEIDAIFQNMRVDANSDFPHPGLVRLILKCMMSKPSDSYWNSGKWVAITEDLDILIKELDCFEYVQIKHNHLTKSGDLPIETPLPRTSPEKELVEIQERRYDEAGQCVERLILGIRYFDRIAHMVRTEIKGGSDIMYLANISPSSLDEQRNAFVPRLAFFEKKEDFEAVVETGNPRTLMQLFSAGGLRPPFVDGLVLEGEVWVQEGQESPEQLGKGVQLGYELWGRGGCLPREQIEDCRLLLDTSATERISLAVVQNHASRGVLHAQGDAAKQLSAHEGRYRAYFVKRFNPEDYYISMLGVYIRLIFFVDPATGQTHTPQSIYFFEEGRSLNRVELAKLPRLGGAGSMPLKKLFSFMAGIYTRLLTLQLDNGSPPVVADRLIGNLKDGIAYALCCKSKDQLMNDPIGDLVGIGNNGKLKMAEFPDIDRLVNDNIVVRAGPRS